MVRTIGKSVTLHNGIVMPSLGYRVDKENLDVAYDNVLKAVKAGFRHFDLTCNAEMEELATQALMDSGVPRYELFLSMKLANHNHGYEKATGAIERSLRRARTDYVDLYLINWPNPREFRSQYETISIDTWRALEDAYKSGKAHAIGVANYEARHIEHLLEHCNISPMVNQARIYPGFPFKDNFECAKLHSLTTEGYLPPFHEEILNCSQLRILADKYGCSPRALCASYLMHKGCIALCQGSDHRELEELQYVYDISLTDKEISLLDHMENFGPANINPDTCDF